MKKTITALLVTAALAGSSGAMAQRWQGGHGNNNGGGNGGQSWSGHGGGNSGQNSGQGGGNGGHGHWSGGNGGLSGQSQFRMQSQNSGSGGQHWGGRGSSNFQGGANVQVQQNWQGGGNGGRSRWNGGGNLSARQWNGNGVGWNGNDGGSPRHYRQDRDGSWRNQGDNDQSRRRSGNWNNGNHWNNGGNWNNGGSWNNGHGRDDWRSWRNSNRDLFHLRRYEGPRGYSYRRFDRGYRIDPFFYDQQYWIDDPWQYRLPQADGPYRWVRYYNDALLVNIYTGEVEDVISDFFW